MKLLHKSLLASLLGYLGACGLHASSSKPSQSIADSFLKPDLLPGQTISDITYRVISMHAPGMEEKVFQAPSTGTLTILPNSTAQTIRWSFVGRADGNGSFKGMAGEYRDQLAQTCIDNKCTANTDASAPFYKANMWGAPVGDLITGRTWTVTLPSAWELGPPGMQRITVLSVDKVNGIVMLKREGDGTGAYAGARDVTTIKKDGKSYTVAVKRGLAHWSGQAIFQHGIVLSDELLCVTPVQLSSPEVGVIQAQERQYMSVLQHPEPTIAE